MQTVKDVMTTDVVTVSPETDIKDAVRIIIEKHINGVPVVDADGKLRGILCQSDLITQQKNLSLPSFFTVLDGYVPLVSMKHLEREIEKIAATTVADAMTTDVVTVSPDTSIEDAATIMVEKKFYTLPVVDKGKLVGVVGQEDILRTLPDL